MKSVQLNNVAANIVAQTGEEVNPFATLLRNYETAYSTGADFTKELYELATACALSVVKKCADPQRKSATERETVSNAGQNPAMVALRRGIVADRHALDNIRTLSDMASTMQYKKDGDLTSVTVDSDASHGVDTLVHECLTDGIDLVQSAIVSILEQSAEHATNNPGWMETTYTTRRLNKKVMIKSDDSAKWEDVETSPIQEVYRHVRREVQNSRAVQTDPRNGYLYIEDVTADPDSTKEETIYHRLQKWADMGGYTHDGEYTADLQTMHDYNDILEQLQLTDRQMQIVSLRMRGYGYKAIATYLGVHSANVQTIIKRLQKKCETLGFTPTMWAEMTATY